MTARGRFFFTVSDDAQFARASAPPSPPTLYERIGGRPALLVLLRHFYADVRQHAEIAPIFAAQISDWPGHLEKIADFWSGVTGGPRLYTGGMPWKHIPLRLEERHFLAWLELWRRNCHIYLSADAAEDMIAAAESFGLRLRQIIAEYGPRDQPGATAPRQ